MCCFGGDVHGAPVEVSQTRIFARADGSHQVLIYAMQLAAPREVAMILPLPVPPRSAEDAVSFVDLSKYRHIFQDLEACFHEPDDDDLDYLLADDETTNLRVHEVGAFVASYVPTRADFTRLDPRFRLSDAIWRRLPMYEDWGFAAIQLRAGRQEVHPIALSFPRRWVDRLFFPTVHVHDGSVHDRAYFDHMLYFQGMPAPTRRGAGSEHIARSAALRAPGTGIAAASLGLIDPELALERLRLHGARPNEDVWLTPGD